LQIEIKLIQNKLFFLANADQYLAGAKAMIILALNQVVH